MEDPLRAARGILLGIGLGIFAWVGLWIFWLAVTRWW